MPFIWCASRTSSTSMETSIPRCFLPPVWHKSHQNYHRLCTLYWSPSPNSWWALQPSISIILSSSLCFTTHRPSVNTQVEPTQVTSSDYNHVSHLNQGKSEVRSSVPKRLTGPCRWGIGFPWLQKWLSLFVGADAAHGPHYIFTLNCSPLILYLYLTLTLQWPITHLHLSTSPLLLCLSVQAHV